MPSGTAFSDIEDAARDYLDAAAAMANLDELQRRMFCLDAAVLRQYALPVELEWILLSLFTGWDRVGVPFKQARYFPPELARPIGIAAFVAYESDWPAANRRRGELIDKEIARTITSGEASELAGLQEYADYYLERSSPRPTQVLENLEDHVFGKATVHKKKGE